MDATQKTILSTIGEQSSRLQEDNRNLKQQLKSALQSVKDLEVI